MKNLFIKNFLPLIVRQKGAAAILLAVLVLSIMLVIGLGASVLITSQLRMSTDAGQSVLSFYAADAGAERCLCFVRDKGYGGCDSGNLSNGANFSAQKVNSTTIRSSGSFGATSRKVELTW